MIPLLIETMIQHNLILDHTLAVGIELETGVRKRDYGKTCSQMPIASW